MHITLKMKQPWPLLIFALSLTVSAMAQLASGNDTREAKCQAYLQTPLPAEAADVPPATKWPDCDSPKLYFGIGVKIDIEAARKCAFSERSAIEKNLEPRYSVSSVIGGPAMLSVIYANGEGIERNISLALRFACEANFDGDFEAIKRMKNKANEKFVYCDEVRTTFAIGFCAALNDEMYDEQRRREFEDLTSSWNEPQKSAFSKLARAERSYAEAYARGEIDLSGSGRAIWQFDAEEAVEASFVAAIHSFENGHLPEPPKQDARDVNAELNSVYKKALLDAEKTKSNYGAIQPDGIRNAERAWLNYRDAWIDFARLRYPRVSAEQWLTLLTLDRIATIKGEPCSSDPDDSDCGQAETDNQDTHAPRPLP